MSTLVLKFGGTSMAGPERIAAASAKVAAEVERGHRVAVVVSAMAGITDQLIESCAAIDANGDPAEYDAVLCAGEQVAAGLMALALPKAGLRTRSFTGWQAGLRTDSSHGRARILDFAPQAIAAAMDQGIVPVLAGFQGVDEQGRVTTLGRGGSDASAVALAAALKADRCDIYTDVDGVYTTDPRIVPTARKIDRISYEEMQEMATLGAKVLMNRAGRLAMAHRVPVQVLSSFDDRLGSDLPGTMMIPEEERLEQEIISGVAFSRNEAKVTIMHVPDRPGVASALFAALAKAGVNVDMIVQNIAPDGQATDITFTLVRDDLDRASAALAAIPELKGAEIRADASVAKVSIVGVGIAAHAGVAAKMFAALAERGINIQVISNSEIRISVLIADEYTELAVRTLHTAFELDGKREG